MSEDFAFVQARIPNYKGYEDEPARHDSEIRVRAILGESLSDANVRLGSGLDEGQAADYEDVLMQCMFEDQAFVRNIQHADLDAAAIAALVASDRAIVALEARVNNATSAAELVSLLDDIKREFTRRHALAAR